MPSLFRQWQCFCRGSINSLPWVLVYGGLWRGVNMAERSGMGVARVYPALDPTMVAKPYVLLQFTIMATSARLQ
jgi:hypothetical protein